MLTISSESKVGGVVNRHHPRGHLQSQTSPQNNGYHTFNDKKEHKEVTTHGGENGGGERLEEEPSVTEKEVGDVGNIDEMHRGGDQGNK